MTMIIDDRADSRLSKALTGQSLTCTALAISCCAMKHLKTQWLTTAPVIRFAHRSAVGPGLGRGSSSLPTQHQLAPASALRRQLAGGSQPWGSLRGSPVEGLGLPPSPLARFLEQMTQGRTWKLPGS